MKKFFAKNIYEKRNLLEALLPLPMKMGHWFYVSKNDFENLSKLENHFNIFVFFIKISCQSKEFLPFLNNPSLLVQSFPF